MDSLLPARARNPTNLNRPSSPGIGESKCAEVVQTLGSMTQLDDGGTQRYNGLLAELTRLGSVND